MSVTGEHHPATLSGHFILMNEEQTEGVLPRVTPGRTKSGGDVRGINTGKGTTKNSSSQSNSEGKICSRYLRASTGSCHDLCKYGGKHTFETNGRHPTFSRFSGSNASSEKDQNRVNSPSLAERHKKSALKHKVTSNSEIGSTVNSILESDIFKQNTVHERSESSEVPLTKCNYPSLPKEVESLEGFETIKQGTPVNIGLCDDTERTAQKTHALLKKTEASRNSHGSYKTIPSIRKAHLSLKPASAEQIQTVRKSYSLSKPKNRQKAPLHVNSTAISRKAKNSKQECRSPASRFDVSARSSISGKSSITLLKSESVLKPGTGISCRNTGRKIVKNVDLPKPGGKKTLKSQSGVLLPQPPVNHDSKSASPVKRARKIKRQSNSSSWQPSPSPSSSSSVSSHLSSSPFVSGNEGEHQDSDSIFSEACSSVSGNGGKGKNSVGKKSEAKKNRRKVATAHSEYKDQTPYKLKFRRGKILNPQSENSVTRRLKFRQGWRVGDIQTDNGRVGNVSFKMKELRGDIHLPDAEAQTVQLRHQDLQDKKDSQGLLNHVIEETATKLVESRKSKVKALVGAFETVISLHETKPAASV